MSLTPSTATGVTAIPAGTYAIDPSHSEVSFVARHAMVTKVRGYFRDVSGEITVGEDFATSSATAVMQTASVDSGSADRDTHLKSADFFDVENNPEITFASTGLRKIEDDEFVLDGDLTISGITKPVSLEVEYEGVAQDPWGNTRIGFSAKTSVERADWNLTWNVGLEAGGVLVSKKIQLVLDLSAVKQA